MHQTESSSRDLNLLVVLRVLLEEGGVTGAARSLGLSPSATSHALARLRDAFDDPLLVREGNRMLATPRAESLRPQLERVLDEARLLYRETPDFKPESSTRDFAIAASDLLAPLLPELMAELGREAPGIRLDLVPEVGESDSRVFATGHVDLGLQSLPTPTSGLETRHLGEADFVVVARADHPFFEQPTLRAWSETPQVTVRTGRAGTGYVGAAVAQAGVSRRVALRVPSFLLAMHTLAETSLLFSAPGPLVRPIAERLGLVFVPIPLEIPRVPIAAVWHERFSRDSGHRWFRERVCEVVARRLFVPADTAET